MNQLVLLERYLPSSIFWPHLEKDKNVDLPVAEILKKYQGFEGEVVSNFVGNPNKDDIQKCLKSKKEEHVLLYINSDDVSLNIPQAIFVGYEVGFFEEDSMYSSIFHEILFGHFQRLVSFKDFLNGNLLFPCRKTAQDYIVVHDALSAEDVPVEDYQKMTVYAVWKYSELP